MKQRSVLQGISMLCLLQLALAVLLLTAIWLFSQFGGESFSNAKDRYREAAQDTILVYPESGSTSEESHA